MEDFRGLFDFCKCNIPCPCTFAQAPTYGDCEDVLAYHIRSGHYGETLLDGLNLLALSYFKGNIWAGNTKANIASFVDEQAAKFAAAEKKKKEKKWALVVQS